MVEATLDLCAAAECLLFVSREPIPAGRLAECLGVTTDEIPPVLEQLSTRLEGHGLHVVLLAGGYSLATRETYAEVVRVFLEPKPEELSRAALETLAIIAYRQPITRPQIELVRGVNSAGPVRTLLDKGLVNTAGREKVPGRPFRFVTTAEFLKLFGLANLQDLPPLSDDAAETLAKSLSRGLEDKPAPAKEEEEPFEFEA
ncbi:MAG TPA: SMC-Scp complex subunit ScpB [Armatimonadota bacterium]|jgi:segregation and condensation protein B